MELGTILILSAILNFIVVIAFFVLVSYVGDIKKKVVNQEQSFGALFNFYYSIGDKAKARELLIDRLKRYQDFDQVYFSELSSKTAYRKEFCAKYEMYTKMVGIEFDFDIVDSINKEICSK